MFDCIQVVENMELAYLKCYKTGQLQGIISVWEKISVMDNKILFWGVSLEKHWMIYCGPVQLKIVKNTAK